MRCITVEYKALVHAAVHSKQGIVIRRYFKLGSVEISIRFR
jgi:hypothetical protein